MASGVAASKIRKGFKRGFKKGEMSEGDEVLKGALLYVDTVKQREC